MRTQLAIERAGLVTSTYSWRVGALSQPLTRLETDQPTFESILFCWLPCRGSLRGTTFRGPDCPRCRETPSRSLVLVFDLTSHFLFPQQRFVFRVQSRDLDLNSVPLRQPRPFQLSVQLSQQSLNCFLSSVHLNVQSPLFRVSL
jgi:hypothetical protein